MQRKLFLTAFLLFASLTTVTAQKFKRPDSYNYKRGIEAVQNKNSEEALEYFNKDLSDDPKNGYTFSWISMLRLDNGEYGKALTAADLAIKYLPKKDVEYVIFAYLKISQNKY